MGIPANFRILVVDDDAQLRELIARSMRRAGNFVVTAEDAEVALAQTELGRAPFDVVVTDVHLPQMSGIELAAILLDMLRVELDPNGEFNVTEFGSTQDRKQYEALRAYSPYHTVREGVRYPAVFMFTGENDGRVHPAHSRKMTARLQAATASSLPIYLITTDAAGHGQGSPLRVRIAQTTDYLAFLFDQLGMTMP